MSNFKKFSTFYISILLKMQLSFLHYFTYFSIIFISKFNNIIKKNLKTLCRNLIFNSKI